MKNLISRLTYVLFIFFLNPHLEGAKNLSSIDFTKELAELNCINTNRIIKLNSHALTYAAFIKAIANSMHKDDDSYVVETMTYENQAEMVLTEHRDDKEIKKHENQFLATLRNENGSYESELVIQCFLNSNHKNFFPIFRLLITNPEAKKILVESNQIKDAIKKFIKIGTPPSELFQMLFNRKKPNYGSCDSRVK